MEPPFQFSSIALVDAALARVKAAGQEPDQKMIAFMWKIVRGEVSSDEIEAWSQETAARLDAEAKVTFKGVLASEPDVVALEERLRGIRQQVAELGDQLAAMTSAVAHAGKQGDEER